MKNKQHEYILKAFLESSIPPVIRRRAPELMTIDPIIDQLWKVKQQNAQKKRWNGTTKNK